MSESRKQGKVVYFKKELYPEDGPFNGANPISAERVLDLIEALEGILTEMKYGIVPYERDHEGFPVTDEGRASTYLVKSVFDIIGHQTTSGIIDHDLLNDMVDNFDDEESRKEYLPIMEHYKKFKPNYDAALKKLLKDETA